MASELVTTSMTIRLLLAHKNLHRALQLSTEVRSRTPASGPHLHLPWLLLQRANRDIRPRSNTLQDKNVFDGEELVEYTTIFSSSSIVVGTQRPGKKRAL